MKLSKHLSRAEFEFSPTAVRRGIANVMNETQLASAILLAEYVFEPLRAFRGAPIKVNSGFRSLALNQAIGGSSRTSQHMKGEALDLPLSAQEFHFIREKLLFDQLIWEFGNDSQPQWVHVSYKAKNNRKQVLKAVKVAGKTKYLPFK
jgi:zinc D-Ala-D-Ala carboxypeptidase